jgi:hypothetical protein
LTPFGDDLARASAWVEDYLGRVGDLPVASSVAPGGPRAPAHV